MSQDFNIKNQLSSSKVINHRYKSLYSFDLKSYRKSGGNSNLLEEKNEKSKQKQPEVQNKVSPFQQSRRSISYRQNYNNIQQMSRSHGSRQEMFHIQYFRLNPQTKMNKMVYNKTSSNLKKQKIVSDVLLQKQASSLPKESLIELLHKNHSKKAQKRPLRKQLIKNARNSQKKCQKYQQQRKYFSFLLKKDKYLITQEREPSAKQLRNNYSNRYRNNQIKILNFDSNKDNICPWINYQQSY